MTHNEANLVFACRDAEGIKEFIGTNEQWQKVDDEKCLLGECPCGDTVDLETGTVDGLSGAEEQAVIETLKEEAHEAVDVVEIESAEEHDSKLSDGDYYPAFPNHPDDPIQNNYFN